MSDKDVVKRMLESRAEQNLRESINEGKEFKPEDDVSRRVLDTFGQMDETQKRQFMQKGWKNG